MSDDFDLDRLGDVWRQRPDPKELEALRRSAETVRRRARWGQIVEVVAAVVVSAVVLLLVLSNPRTDTVVVGTGAILILLVSQIRQRRQRKLELMSLTGTAEQMLDQSIARIQTTVRQNRWTLAAMGPGFAIGWLVAFSAERSADGMLDVLPEDPLLRTIWLGSALGLLAAAAFVFLIKIRRQTRELDRLLAMRAFYREEDERAAADGN